MLSILLETLNSHVTWKHVDRDIISGRALSLEFLTQESVLRPESIYIGTAAELSRRLSADSLAPAAIFLSDSSSPMETAKMWNLIGTDLPPLELYQRLNGALDQLRTWERQLGQVAVRTGSIAELLHRAATLAGTGIYLTDETGQTICGDAADTRSSEPDDMSEAIFIPVESSGNTARMLRMSLHSGIPAAGWQIALLHMTAEFVQMLLSNDQEGNTQSSASFDKLFSDLMSGAIEGQDTFALRLRDVKSPFLPDEPGNRHHHLLVVELPPGSTTGEAGLGRFLARIQTLLPDGNFTCYEGRIVGLFIRREACHLHASDFPTLPPLLETFDAYAAVVGLSARYFRIKTLYTMANQSLRVGKQLYARENRRLFFPKDDFLDYMFIDLFRRAYRAVYKHDDVGYYISFPIMQLLRYDRKNNSNLGNMLYYYIISGCNTTKTAERLGLHKNTVANKIKKIQEIIQVDLSDHEVSFSLLLSYKILRYFELCAKLNTDVHPTEVPGEIFLF